MTRFIILLVFLSLSIGFPEAKKIKKDNKKCPTFTNLANFSNPDELKKVQDNVFDSLWDIDSPELTDLAEDFLDILYDMFRSRVPFWRTYVSIVSEYIWIYLPEIKNDLNLCPYAKIINNTLIFQENDDCDLILKSIDSITDEFSARGLTVIRNIIKNAGCNLDGIPTPNQPLLKCYKDGFVYNIEEMWDELGWDYPCNLRDVVLKMYRSCEKQDKFIALIATHLLSKTMSILVEGFDPQTNYQIFTMLTYGKVPKCCCAKLKKDALDLGGMIQKSSNRTFQLARDSTGCSCSKEL